MKALYPIISILLLFSCTSQLHVNELDNVPKDDGVYGGSFLIQKWMYKGSDDSYHFLQYTYTRGNFPYYKDYKISFDELEVGFQNKFSSERKDWIQVSFIKEQLKYKLKKVLPPKALDLSIFKENSEFKKEDIEYPLVTELLKPPKVTVYEKKVTLNGTFDSKGHPRYFIENREVKYKNLAKELSKYDKGTVVMLRVNRDFLRKHDTAIIEAIKKSGLKKIRIQAELK